MEYEVRVLTEVLAEMRKKQSEMEEKYEQVIKKIDEIDDMINGGKKNE